MPNSQLLTILRTYVSLVVFVLIVVQLGIALFFVFTPSGPTIQDRGLTAIYKRYFLPGPYFRDDLIVSSPHFYVTAKTNNKWQTWRNPEEENFNLFNSNYLRYDKLKQSTLERNIARQFCRKVIKSGESGFTGYKEFKALHNYFLKEYIKEATDSIRICYTLSRYKPRERKTKTDTLFLLTYKTW